MSNETIKRPIGVWIISIFFIVSVPAIWLISIWAYSKSPEAFSGLSNTQILISFAASAANLVAAILLFRLRVIAFWIFIAVTVSALIPIIHYSLLGDLGTYLQGINIKKFIFQQFIWVCMLFYLWHLKKQKILA